MSKVKLKILELRKQEGLNQQELADTLGVSFQTVSKWETGITMPDISLLPDISEYFKVTVDELLGLIPLRCQKYIPRESDNHNENTEKYDQLYKNRKYFWNDDYLKFLIDEVWHIADPIQMIEYRCCDGYMGRKLLDLLPKGSTYTGIDSSYYIEKAKYLYRDTKYHVKFFESDLYTHPPRFAFGQKSNFDLAFIQAGLRHMSAPKTILKNMISSIKKDGLVVCAEINREFENDGLYINGMDYNRLCTTFDWHKLWKKELETEGRDYAIGMRLPFYLKELGLHDIDVRLNDKITFANPESEIYNDTLDDFIRINELDTMLDTDKKDKFIEIFMSRGYNRSEIETYFQLKTDMKRFFENHSESSFLKTYAFLISFGRK